MDFTVILIFAVLSAITALMMIFVFKKRSAAGLEDASSDYAEGLNLLLEGDREKASLYVRFETRLSGLGRLVIHRLKN